MLICVPTASTARLFRPSLGRRSVRGTIGRWRFSTAGWISSWGASLCGACVSCMPAWTTAWGEDAQRLGSGCGD
eukprot:5862723-Pyramimonas_sp.AAC.1